VTAECLANLCDLRDAPYDTRQIRAFFRENIPSCPSGGDFDIASQIQASEPGIPHPKVGISIPQLWMLLRE